MWISHVPKQSLVRPFRLRSALLLLCVTQAALLVGCGKGGVESEVKSFKAAGRNVAAFADTDGTALSAKRCQTGTVDGVQTLLCEYASSDAAAMGLQAATAWLGDSPSGLALRRDLLVMALSDRSNADPSGKTMSSLVKIFRQTGKK